MDFFSKINWVDVFIFLVVSKVLITAIKKGLLVEIFKLIGVLASIFFSFEYYIKLSSFIKNYLPINFELLEAISFLLLVTIAYLVFVLLRNLFSFIFKFEAINTIEKILSGIFGLIRGVLFVSLILVFFVLINNSYLITSIQKSLSGKNILSISSKTYNLIPPLLERRICAGSLRKKGRNEIIRNL